MSRDRRLVACTQTFSNNFLFEANMAEVVRVTTFFVIAFVVYFCLLGGNSVDATTVDTSTIQSTATSYHSGEVLSTASPTKITTITNSQGELTKTSIADVECPDGVKCSDLGASCINCALNKLKNSCVYGDNVDVECKPISSKINCTVCKRYHALSLLTLKYTKSFRNYYYLLCTHTNHTTASLKE